MSGLTSGRQRTCIVSVPTSPHSGQVTGDTTGPSPQRDGLIEKTLTLCDMKKNIPWEVVEDSGAPHTGEWDSGLVGEDSSKRESGV